MKQPHGSRVTKKGKKQAKLQECSIWAQAKAIVDSVGATPKKILKKITSLFLNQIHCA